MAVDSRLDTTSNQPSNFRAFFNRRYIMDAVLCIGQLAAHAVKQHEVLAGSTGASITGMLQEQQQAVQHADVDGAAPGCFSSFCVSMRAEVDRACRIISSALATKHGCRLYAAGYMLS
jgi:hypothetical protein